MASLNDLVVGSRLRAARVRLGLSLEDAAARSGINAYQTLSQIEKGSRKLKVAEVSRLCAVYCVNLVDILAEEDVEPQKMEFAWRERTVAKSTLEIEAKLRQVVQDYDMVESLSGEKFAAQFQPWDMPPDKIDRDFVVASAAEVRDKLGLGDRPAACLSVSLEEKWGVRIIQYDLNDFGSAVVACGGQLPAVFLNRENVAGRRNFSLAHELFHLLSMRAHPFATLQESELNGKSKVEKLADRFASELLLPEESVRAELVKRQIGSSIGWLGLVNLALYFRVSTQAMLWRLCSLRIVSKVTVEKVLEDAKFKEFDKRSRDLESDPNYTFSERFVRLAVNALAAGKISKGRFCKMFEIERSDYERFLQSWGYERGVVEGDQVEIAHT